MVILKMEVLGKDTATFKKELITLDAKLLNNAIFHNKVLKLIEEAAEAEGKPQSNINKIMRKLKYDLKKTLESRDKRKKSIAQ